MIESDTMNGVDYIMSTAAVRDRAERMYRLALDGGTNFVIDESRIPETADMVVKVIREQYPDLQVPYHSRWRHFVGDDGNLRNILEKKFKNLPQDEAARAKFDLIIVSVLLDAGAGGSWTFNAPSGHVVARSEGLALASLQMFLEGGFSLSDEPRVDATCLANLDKSAIEAGFQVSPDNPLLGVAGRTDLLRKLGSAMLQQEDRFPTGRPSDLMSYIESTYGTSVDARAVFDVIVDAFGDIWPSRIRMGGKNLGDTWHYPGFGQGLDGLVPLHKLTQWLTYSVIETLEMSGFEVTGIEKLTGLAEYRNGGLFLDAGVLSLRDPSMAEKAHAPGDPIIVEWRSLTATLLDRIAEPVRERLGLTASEFPLPRVLEGGTWLTGRKIAASKRADGGSPIPIASDGTVF